jgi:hypothetical protein
LNCGLRFFFAFCFAIFSRSRAVLLFPEFALEVGVVVEKHLHIDELGAFDERVAEKIGREEDILTGKAFIVPCGSILSYATARLAPFQRESIVEACVYLMYA